MQLYQQAMDVCYTEKNHELYYLPSTCLTIALPRSPARGLHLHCFDSELVPTHAVTLAGELPLPIKEILR
jgi:hypothetical protein